MVRKIYYENPYQKEFTSKITHINIDDDGTWIGLDQTAFYPGGGGQLPDSGTINDIPVQRLKIENNMIYHLIQDKNTFQIGDEVKGRIDFDRRYFFMQAHTAQHLLSGLMEKLFNIQTESVHFSEDYFSIEINAHTMEDSKYELLIQESNAKIRDHLPVRIHMISKEKIHSYPIRKYPDGISPIRVIEIEGVDWSACGGTHVQNTAEIQQISYIGSEPIRKRLRLKFTCGKALQNKFAKYSSVIQELKNILTCDEDSIHPKVSETIIQLKHLSKSVKKLSILALQYMLQYKIQLNSTKEILVLEVPTYLEMDPKSALNVISEFPQLPIILFSINQNNSTYYIVSNRAVSFPSILEPLLREKKIVGGGKDKFFQGKILTPSVVTELKNSLHNLTWEDK